MDLHFENLPDADHPDFSNLIHPSRNPITRQLSYSAARISPNDLSSRRHAPYVSFGDNGVTASGGAYGALMRLCRYIDRPDLRSKMIGLEFNDEAEAWYVYWRAAQFLQDAPLPKSGFGLRILTPLPQESPKLDFLGDRWPVITYRTGGFRVTVTLSCQNHIVVQHTSIRNESSSLGQLELLLDPNFRIQDLDYMEKRENLPARYRKGPHGYGIIAIEDNPDLKPDAERICVLVGLLRDGIVQRLDFEYAAENSEDAMDGAHVRPINFSEQLKENTSLELTAVFKLQTTTLMADWKNFILTSSELDFDFDQDHTLETAKSPFLADEDLSWHFRRNLQHILSVCSVPIKTPTIVESPASPASASGAHGPMITLNTPDDQDYILHGSVEAEVDAKDMGAVALTCGDFGDHLVSVSGTYFAFSFMLRMYDRLPRAPATRQRIHATCRGHLKWLSLLDPSRASVSNFWVDGTVTGHSGATDLPPNSPANMPSHIMKATEYLKIFDRRTELIFVCGWLGPFIVEWFQQLSKTKNRLTPTWQHLDSSEIPFYRLSDHVWIWRALQEIEDLIEKVEKAQKMMPNLTLTTFLRVKEHLPSKGTRRLHTGATLNCTAEEIRKQTLRRFTLDNDILRERMLSVTRSARETRFLLHSRDTILYYGLEWGFFKGEEEMWQQLIEAQTRHDELANDETQWDNPLRYGLAMEMAVHEHKLDRYFEPQDMLEHAKRVILDSSSENGLFPGQIDGFSKDPALFDREIFRDFYFHVGFELPYILFRVALRADSATWDAETAPYETPAWTKPENNPASGGFAQHQRTGTQAPRPTGLRRRIPEMLPMDTTNSVLDGWANIAPDGRFYQAQRSLKRQNPYGRLVDLSNIVEVTEEWLYKYPDFVDFEPPKDEKELKEIMDASPPNIQEGMFDPNELRWDDSRIGGRYSILVDVRKGRKQRKWSQEEKSIRESYDSSLYLWHHLLLGRNAQDSKKRLIYLRSADHVRAMMCYIASPDSDRSHVAHFFDRHAKIDVHFYDDTAVAVNSWVTEVHFRFYQAVQGEVAASPSSIRHLKSQTCRVLGREARIVDAVIGFRIVGDFFDRYWTCHVIDHFADSDEQSITKEQFDSGTHWQQRKVLELVLFDRILHTVCTSIDGILRAVEMGPTDKSDAGDMYFSKDSFEDRRPEDLRECFQVLMILKNNLASLHGLIDQWMHRESLQGRERPRWTRNDEQKYRKAIKQNLTSLEAHVRDLNAKDARIEFLITLVNNAQEAIRSNKSLKEAENITLFTYVTVFFLPVGLAVSVFSMDQPPERDVLVSMVITAIIALVVTVAVLWCVLSHLVPVYVGRAWQLVQGGRPWHLGGNNASLVDLDKHSTRGTTRSKWSQSSFYPRSRYTASREAIDDLERGDVGGSLRTNRSKSENGVAVEIDGDSHSQVDKR
ncbi:uncharacterized protein ACLA_087570 [Aspergillus clavatus NRRL 1]|uniref:Uncharacterized protein n=1 Tax=Aspergillus clavatus (strain ATCC 1007 / CBS 513.65 / DSM 816 / NCTC 3887 / NRRL 1 / QM 1276 / 107) TaxID=344612 RepID=A1CUR4_ASPCL|nr:uncharacterized protein ACLA_087570 [Aspergillus clavatus NRRL 1]EAW07051.1 hypothetical protein ACLA_087570 [Aspergillus clavatus NRRL 1]